MREADDIVMDVDGTQRAVGVSKMRYTPQMDLDAISYYYNNNNYTSYNIALQQHFPHIFSEYSPDSTSLQAACFGGFSLYWELHLF
jgi:hypothetical protein